VVEFVSSSVTANWPEQLARPVTENLPHNPHVRFYEPDKRGYLLHDVNESEWKTTFRAMQDVRDQTSPATDLAKFLVTRGKPGFEQIS
jgi:alkaline phosphatase D